MSDLQFSEMKTWKKTPAFALSVCYSTLKVDYLQCICDAAIHFIDSAHSFPFTGRSSIAVQDSNTQQVRMYMYIFISIYV